MASDAVVVELPSPRGIWGGLSGARLTGERADVAGTAKDPRCGRIPHHAIHEGDTMLYWLTDADGRRRFLFVEPETLLMASRSWALDHSFDEAQVRGMLTEDGWGQTSIDRALESARPHVMLRP